MKQSASDGRGRSGSTSSINSGNFFQKVSQTGNTTKCNQPRKASKRFSWFERMADNEMTPKETLTLNWWDKWKIYRKFPWKLVFQVIICAVATWLVGYRELYDRLYVIPFLFIKLETFRRTILFWKMKFQ